MSPSWRTIAAVLVGLIAFVSCGSNTGTATLINKADEPIARATLTTSSGETLTVTDLAPAEIATVNYSVRGEGDYRVDVVFRSGKRLEAEGVYIVSGFDYLDQIAVTSSEIHVSHTTR